ncbi:phosphopentomutase [Cohnella massiliensis]|uniref:phosphopentomutase n=1 Tax=Cohnella massiliensis TaxID=1816691 RepID=UPI0009BACCE9|nr:phosphopentomutase [Cohnella massiliensis]
MTKPFQRVFLIVLDSVGIGELPDAAAYGDAGAHTLGNIAKAAGPLALPHLERLGLGAIAPVDGIAAVAAPRAHYGKMAELSKGKDTLTGHWELMGVPMDVAFQTYPSGFPEELIQQLEAETGRGVIGNKVASGTDIIKELGAEHQQSGSLIVYTSADSVLQIAAHEDTVPLEELYDICAKARKLTLSERYFVGRVIARPFAGAPGRYERTPNRKDYAVAPPRPTVLNGLVRHGYDSIGIGKISDIFAGEGISESWPTKSNAHGIETFLGVMNMNFTGLCFLNLVDFDSLYGHRRDPKGYGAALEHFDAKLPDMAAALREDDLLIVTADHGNDPTHSGTDHTREYVPLLALRKGMERGSDLGVRATFADVGATIADNFKIDPPEVGTSFLRQL